MIKPHLSCSLLPAHFPSCVFRVQKCCFEANAIVFALKFMLLPTYALFQKYMAPPFSLISSWSLCYSLFLMSPLIFQMRSNWWNKRSPIISTKTLVERCWKELSGSSSVRCSLPQGFVTSLKVSGKKYPHLNYIYRDNIFWTQTLNIMICQNIFVYDLWFYLCEVL